MIRLIGCAHGGTQRGAFSIYTYTDYRYVYLRWCCVHHAASRKRIVPHRSFRRIAGRTLVSAGRRGKTMARRMMIGFDGTCGSGIACLPPRFQQRTQRPRAHVSWRCVADESIDAILFDCGSQRRSARSRRTRYRLCICGAPVDRSSCRCSVVLQRVAQADKE